MLIAIARRLNLLIITLFILCLASYVLAFLFPGDALTNLSGIPALSADQSHQLQLMYALNEGWFSGFWTYLKLTLNGDWGVSLNSQTPIFEDILKLLPASLELSLYAMVISLVVGLPLGVLAGLKHRSYTDMSILSVSLTGFSFPVFWLSLLLILIFSLQLGYLPMSGRISLLFDIPHSTGFILVDILRSEMPVKDAALFDALRHLVLPTLSLSIVTTALVIRLIRRSVVTVYASDFIKAAYTKGLSHSQVFWRHGMKNALLPIMPQLAMQFTVLLTNAMIVEVIFSWPGIGEWLIQAIYQRDFPAIRGGMLAVSAVVVTFTISVELLVRILYPLNKRQFYAQT
ncbi:ABC transporter permease [Lacimicrobium alkaliphilum]|uniref:Antimicrobial peptide ABC transporter permease SapB n=1 Tax=Lacimicrobium alkaliphilum TaxID=1526571 RepID=A0ABQ1R362_9ALTE|nr:ABC transporter permease subunit [Lacimicrobium alkaliphilum]GGD56392.1 antimicrobial peptide ABC transporter permease SapB [Lacimicrobium alkaliphilum]